MKERKSTEDSINTTKQKPKSIGKLFGYLKTKIKDSIHDLTSMTTYSQNAGRQEEVVGSPHNIVHCPIPKPPRRSSYSIVSQKPPVSISKEHDQLLAIQVQKCYRNLPEMYFMRNYDIDKNLLAKSLKENNQKLFQMNDYLDEVQFNIQELVKSKQSQILVALDNMNSMDSQINHLIVNLRNLRNNNKEFKGKLTGRAEKIKELQSRSDYLTKMVNAISNMKLLVSYPMKIRATFAKDKALAVRYFNQYLNIHQNYKTICGCTNKQRKQCQYQTIKQYIKTGFQQTFSKSYWNYITQGLFYQQNQLKNIFGFKKDFQSMPGMSAGFNLASFIASGALDESICEEQKYQLAIKQNVEEELKTLVLAGLTVCDFDNANVLTNLAEFMEDFEKGFLTDVLTEIKESFMMETDNHLVVQSKGIKVLLEELSPLIQKLKMSKFLKIVDFYSEIVKKAIRRTFSILYRISKALEIKKIKRASHVQMSLVQICLQVTNFADKYLSKFIELGQIPKQQNLSTFRDLVQVFESWENFTQEIEQYFIADLHSDSDTIKKGICKLHNLEALKIKLAGLHLKGLHQNVLTKELKNSMEQERWVEVDIDPKYYNVLGYILQGEKFNQDRKRLALLSSSLFLENKPTHQRKEINFDYFSISHNEIIIHNRRYRPTQSLLVLIEIIQQYLKMNEIDEQMNCDVSNKLLELINFYNSFLFQLILNASAVHHNKIGNAITIRHLSLSYHAISFMLTALNSLKQRIQGVDKIAKLMQKMISHQQQIIKKIQSIIPHRISQQVKLMSLQKPGPSKGTQNITSYLRNVNDTLKQYFEEQQVRRIWNSNMLAGFIQKLLKFRPKTKSEQECLEMDISYFIISTEFLTNSMPGYEDIKKQLNNISKFQ